MKAIITVQKEVELKYLKIQVPVRYEDEDIPYDFPLRDGDKWSCTVDLDTHIILEWPKGQTGELSMKVCDEGYYTLIDDENNTVLSIDQDYVPNSLIPGKYGDYIHLIIDSDGCITNWRTDADITDFIDND